MLNSFKCHDTLTVDGVAYQFANLHKLEAQLPIGRLPMSLKVLLENCLRREDGHHVKAADIEAIASHAGDKKTPQEIAFMPARVLLQDFTGVPAIVDLAAMRDAIRSMGGNAEKINPLQPAELVIDHSVQVDNFGSMDARDANSALEFHRNKERYQFLRWGQCAFSNFKVVPPDTGIVHQVNLEYLARVVFTQDATNWLYPDTLVGTDSHTTMINGLGVLGWGVGGIEAEAAMLGQPISMLIPEVIGFELSGTLPEGATATDLVLMVTEMLRAKGVVGKFVEFFGDGLSSLPLADRATIANMAPEYGATCGYFPVDNETLKYLALSGRSQQHIRLVETYARTQGLFREDGMAPAHYTDTLQLNLADVVPSIAGPKRPQDRISLKEAKQSVQKTLEERVNKAEQHKLSDGSVVIAAITSCTNTSNPSVMIGAGLLAKKAVERGLNVPNWVKTSLAPGSKVVTEYLEQSGLLSSLEQLGFNVVGYGCTTCIGNSGPLPDAVSQAIKAQDLHVCSVLSGNRNFEGRIHPEIRNNYLASPPLVVAYALAGTMNIDLYHEPLGVDKAGQPVYLKDLWPSQHAIQSHIEQNLSAQMYSNSYESVYQGDNRWNALEIPSGSQFEWSDDSTYVKKPPFFDNMSVSPEMQDDIHQARVLVKLGDSVTTDHISPAGNIKADSPAGLYLTSRGIKPADFNSYGSRRGNHEVMMRGTFANVRLRNQLAPGTEGGVSVHVPTDEQMSIYDCAMRYQDEQTPCIILAGKEYGSGSSRDWAAKGTRLLGVKAVIAESFERIHRSNLVGMGVLPLTFIKGESAESLGLTGKELYSITGIDDGNSKKVTVSAQMGDKQIQFEAIVRLDTPQEIAYYQHGGILHYVLRQLKAAA